MRSVRSTGARKSTPCWTQRALSAFVGMASRASRLRGHGPTGEAVCAAAIGAAGGGATKAVGGACLGTPQARGTSGGGTSLGAGLVAGAAGGAKGAAAKGERAFK